MVEFNGIAVKCYVGAALVAYFATKYDDSGSRASLGVIKTKKIY